MKKRIKLTESDLYRIISRIILEQDLSVNSYEGTTSPEPIRTAGVLQKVGLKSDNTNWSGAWQLIGFGNVEMTFGRVKNLSLFTSFEPKSNAGNYIEITLYRFNIKNNKKDDQTTPKVFKLIDQGLPVKQSVQTYFYDTDKNYVWKIDSIRGANNGLLALSRILQESKTPNPTQLSFGFRQGERTSSALSFDTQKISNIGPALNGFALMIAAETIRKSNIPGIPNGIKCYDDVKNIMSNQDQIIKRIVDNMYSHDYSFIPTSKKADVEKNPGIYKYNNANLSQILNKAQSIDRDKLNRFYLNGKCGPNVQDTTFNYNYSLVTELQDEFIKQLKLRLKSYFKQFQSQIPDYESKIDQLTFNKPTSNVGREIKRLLCGCEMGAVQMPSANISQSSGTYKLGSAEKGTK